jgi:hypothetical protein
MPGLALSRLDLLGNLRVCLAGQQVAVYLFVGKADFLLVGLARPKAG